MKARDATITGALATLLALGCTQAHAPEAVGTGIYELSVQTELEACTPARAAGSMGPVAVLVDGTTIDAPVPDVEAPALVAPRVRLSPSASYHAETNRRLGGCDGAWVHEEWTVLEAGSDGFELLHTQRWRGLSGCAELDATAPRSDCTSERRLRYGLQSRCEAPCSLALTADGVTCRC